MPTIQTPPSRTSDATIFWRVLNNGRGPMSAQLARYILTLGFDDDDQARMSDLATRNQDNRLSPGELEELQSFVKAGHLLVLLQSKARKTLKR
jgi:hypothetical protein